MNIDGWQEQSHLSLARQRPSFSACDLGPRGRARGRSQRLIQPRSSGPQLSPPVLGGNKAPLRRLIQETACHCTPLGSVFTPRTTRAGFVGRASPTQQSSGEQNRDNMTRHHLSLQYPVAVLLQNKQATHLFLFSHSRKKNFSASVRPHTKAEKKSI